MDERYAEYCLVDPVFYDSPALLGGDLDFEVGRRRPPEGWVRRELDDWLMYRPAGVDLPPQGWKIRASACLDNAEEILIAVWEYCVPRRTAFKLLRGPHYLLFRNGRYAPRGSCGELVTIYPQDETHLRAVLTELGGILNGQPGPSILTDLRWGAGPLHVGYGAFAEWYCVRSDGERELAIADATGRLVPELRRPTFEVPPWVTLPEFLAPHLAARNNTTVEDLPYRIEGALHFANGGGLYAADDVRTGDKVVLKEARPHAGLALDGADAVSRLLRERDALEQLTGLDVVPTVRDYFTLEEHHFLVQDFVDATALSALVAERHPLTVGETDEGTLAEYASWALDAHGRIERAVDAVHGRGIVIGDLHPHNIMVRPDGRVVLVDFGSAADADEVRQQTLTDAIFPASTRTGFDIDCYALACLRLFLFLPLISLLALDPAKAEELASEIGDLFPVPRHFLTEAVQVIGGAGHPSGDDRGLAAVGRPELDADLTGWQRARASMAQAILSSASLHRDDRLFPGDVRQFATGGLNLAHGAAGVLYALAITGAGRDPAYEEWLVERATHPNQGTRLGLYDGLHGVAYVLDHLDRRGDALKVLSICADELGRRLDHLGLDLYGGLAGIGLDLAHFAAVTGDPSLQDDAWRVATVVADRLGDEDSVPELSGGDHPFAGLVRGSSGQALLFIRLYEQTGDSGLLDLAAIALRQDLRRCIVRIEDGALEVNEGWRTMPYLADGSVGIGLVLDDYLAHRENEQFAEAFAAIRRAARGRFCVESGLFYGRAGMILGLSGNHPVGTAGHDPDVMAQIRRLAWHALSYKGGLAFPGEKLLRLSMDLATGTSGVLLALGAALHDAPVYLPFLEPRRVRLVRHTG